MFDLEQSLSAWRNEMSRARLAAGKSESEAFTTAAHRLGSPAELKIAFKKANFRNPLALWPHALLLLLAASCVALHIWTGDGFREFSVVYCLLLSLALPLFAGSQPVASARLSQRRFRTMLTGQILIGVAAALIILSPFHPLVGLSLGFVGCAFFVRQLRRQSRHPQFFA